MGEGEGGEEIWVLCHCLKATSKNRAFSAFSGLLRARQDAEQSVSMDTREGRGKNDQTTFHSTIPFRLSNVIPSNCIPKIVFIYNNTTSFPYPPFALNLPRLNDRKYIPCITQYFNVPSSYIHSPSPVHS